MGPGLTCTWPVMREEMTVGRHHSGYIWGGRVLAALVVAGLGIYLSTVGLDKADKLASVLGLLVAAVALVAPYLLPSSDRRSSESGPVQSVANTVVGGHLTQMRDAKGVQVQGSVTALPPQTAPPGVVPPPDLRGGQYVNGVWVGGNLTQSSGTDGDMSVG
jgi:hypothetical protein